MYCGNPNPTVRISTSRELDGGLGVKTLRVSYRGKWDLKDAPKISCNFCDRKYTLLANSANKPFLQEILSQAVFSDALGDIMFDFGISLEDIKNGFLGIVLPEGLKTSLRRAFKAKKEFHILFTPGETSAERRFYMTLYKCKNQLIGVNVEKI